MNKYIRKAGVIIFLLTVAVFTFIFVLGGESSVTIEAEEYKAGDEMKITVKNNYLASEICFSSCYPYLFQKKVDGSWKEYSYEDCDFEDKIVECVPPLRRKTFRARVDEISRGTHRLSVPICKDCNLGTIFQEEKQLYSNEFEMR